MKLTYRPEIDGLRCIAVTLVILHHLEIPGFSGGFVGVDVFFVISGYLITAIILKELAARQFTFGDFYKRRVIRLAPAYFSVLLATVIAASFLMLPAELEKFSVSVLYSTFFAANFYMWNAVGGYFGSGADTTPLLHLWSLAVEEQFYLIWPVALLILYKVVSSKWLFITVLVALVVTLVVSEYGAMNYRAAAYYLMPTRAFELLLGAAAAFIPMAVAARLPVVGRCILAIIGLVSILYSTVFFTAETWFPGINAFFPCVGTLLIIIFLRSSDPVLGPLMANPIVVSIGKISYPAYLWHWPIIAFLNLQMVELTPIISFGVIALTLILAALTYLYIEKPAQSLRLIRWPKIVLSGYAAPSLVFVFFAITVFQMNGMPSRFDEALTQRSAAVLSYAYDVRGSCNEGFVKSPSGPEECILGINKPDVDFLLLGDSHANHFTGMFDVMAADAGLRGYDITQSNSPFLIDVKRYYEQDGVLVLHNNFKSRNDVLRDQVITQGYDYVVLAGAYQSHLATGHFKATNVELDASDTSVFQQAMVKTLSYIVEQGSIPILVKGNPSFEFDVASCTLNNLRFDLAIYCDMSKEDYLDKFRAWDVVVKKLQEQFDSLIVVDPAKVMCDSSKCYSELKGTPLYKDHGHLNYIGSKLIGELYLVQEGNPFLSVKKRTQTTQL